MWNIFLLQTPKCIHAIRHLSMKITTFAIVKYKPELWHALLLSNMFNHHCFYGVLRLHKSHYCFNIRGKDKGLRSIHQVFFGQLDFLGLKLECNKNYNLLNGLLNLANYKMQFISLVASKYYIKHIQCRTELYL